MADNSTDQRRAVRLKLRTIACTGLLLVAIALPAAPGESTVSSANREGLQRLRDQILTTFDKSVAACSVYQGGNPDCVKKHFRDAYAWYVLGEKDLSIGPPGTPWPVGYKDKLPLNVDSLRQSGNQDH
jgi:hypothetical protein